MDQNENRNNNVSAKQQADFQALMREAEEARKRLVYQHSKNALKQREAQKLDVSKDEYALRLQRSLKKDNIIVDDVRTQRIEKALSDWKLRVGKTFAEAETDLPLIHDRVTRLRDGRGTHMTSIVLHGNMGVGKAQPLTEPVLTSEGFKPISEVGVGSKVYSPSVGLVDVIGEHFQSERKVYLVKFSDGSSTLADGEHLWLLFDILKNEDIVVTVDQLLEMLKTSDAGRFVLPLSSPVEFPTKVDSGNTWAWGYLYGSVAVTGNKRAVINKKAKDVLCYYELDETLKLSFLSDDSYVVESILPEDIPDFKDVSAFNIGDIEQRVAFLRGYFEANSVINSGIKGIIESLGGTVSKDKSYFRLPEYYYALFEDVDVFSELKPERVLESIVFDSIADTKCISVDSDDSLYITRDYIVTHNTWTAYGYINLAIQSGYVTAGQIVADTETGVLSKIAVSGYKKPELLEELMSPRHKMFFIDDVGQGYYSDSQKRQEIWFELIDHVYSHQLTLIMTTNLTPSQLKHWMGERAYDRLVSMVGSDGYFEPSKNNKRSSVLEKNEKEYRG